ncbi:hypothetical protein [Haloplasma contractile]|uniref:Uncharacterized protein n=1 Tax=Haloplasma contractile SSD-17B TaxID=1033810 RepID=F7PWF4_9MOLU|nr:hypothetical protein [Haloplasma contractile]ERJ11873.1 hypothetical protein HLPCO_002113 [Haloplasma contractile SSD-17B]
MGFDFVDDDQAVEPEMNHHITRRPTYYGRRRRNDSVVGIGTWIGIILLHGMLGLIPVIGPFLVLIFLIVLAVININQSIKNFARAILIIVAIAFLILLLIQGIVGLNQPYSSYIFQVSDSIKSIV